MIKITNNFLAVATLALCTLTYSFSSLAENDYIELCSADQYQALKYGDGNPAGHALVYINGLCKDMDKDYPQVKLCDEQDNHKGVGISLDSAFKNVSWIAVPTKELTLFGDYGTNKVDEDTIAKIFEQAQNYRVFENVRADRSSYPQAILNYTSDPEQQDILFAIGTDLAFNTARSMYCLRANVSKTQLKQVQEYLNAENDHYYHGGNEYSWSISDNCTHLSVNALAAAGLTKKKKIKNKRNLIGKIFTLTLPKSELFKAAKKVNKSKYNPRKIWRSKKLRRFFLKHNRLPYGANNLVTKYDAIRDNEFFITKDASFFALPVLGMSLKKLSKENKYTDKKINNELHLKKIEKALMSKFFKRNFKNKKKNEFKVKYLRYLNSERLELQN